jgi:hypothetical protein
MAESVAALNHLLESGHDLPPDIWDRWLWHTDAAVPGTPECLLNEMHLLGLIIARYRAMREPKLSQHVLNIPRLTHTRTRVSTLSPRQLKDVVEDIQMHWVQYLEDPSLADEIADSMDACMARFGEINLRATPCDDVSMAESGITGPPNRLSQVTLRRFVSIFFVLYRHLHMYHNCQPPRTGYTLDVPQFEEFHLSASMETFNRYTMHMDIPPAARLIYRQDFAGFYNCISQVVYFHFPSYERKVQLPLKTLRTGKHPIYALAPLMEMFPDITLAYEDEPLDDGAWHWVVMGYRVYLVSPRMEIFYSDDLVALVTTARGMLEGGGLDRLEGPDDHVLDRVLYPA